MLFYDGALVPHRFECAANTIHIIVFEGNECSMLVGLCLKMEQGF